MTTLTTALRATNDPAEPKSAHIAVKHAQMDRDKAETYIQTLTSKRAFAEWAAARVLQHAEFPNLLFGHLQVQVEAQRWRDSDRIAPSPDSGFD